MRELLKGDDVQSFGSRHGLRSQQHRVDQAKCCCTPAHCETKRENRGQGRGFPPENLTPAESGLRSQCAPSFVRVATSYDRFLHACSGVLPRFHS